MIPRNTASFSGGLEQDQGKNDETGDQLTGKDQDHPNIFPPGDERLRGLREVAQGRQERRQAMDDAEGGDGEFGVVQPAEKEVDGQNNTHFGG